MKTFLIEIDCETCDAESMRDIIMDGHEEYTSDRVEVKIFDVVDSQEDV